MGLELDEFVQFINKLVEIMKKEGNYTEKLKMDILKTVFVIFEKSPDTLPPEIQEIIKKILKTQDSKLEDLQFKENLPTINTRRPKELVASNTRVSNEIFKKDNEEFYLAPILLAVEERKRKKGKPAAKPISVSVSLRYDPEQDPNIKLVGKRLTNFDKIVHDAVVTQFVDGGNRYITTDMIAYVINGGKDVNGDNKKMRDAINESIKRLYDTSVIIDAKGQAKEYGLDGLKFKGHILDFEIITATINGQETECMNFSERTPILYRYADTIGQVIRSDLSVLNVPSLQNYPENIELKNYLLHRLEIMLHNEKMSRIIRYDEIFDLLNVTAENAITLRRKKQEIRKKVKKCLDYWAETGKITEDKKKFTSYKEIKDAGEITKVEIEMVKISQEGRQVGKNT